MTQTDDLNEPVTRREFHEFKDYAYRSFDHMTEILERLDQERLFTTEGIRRLEVTDENHEKRLSKLEKAMAI